MKELKKAKKRKNSKKIIGERQGWVVYTFNCQLGGLQCSVVCSSKPAEEDLFLSFLICILLSRDLRSSVSPKNILVEDCA